MIICTINYSKVKNAEYKLAKLFLAIISGKELFLSYSYMHYTYLGNKFFLFFFKYTMIR